MLRTITLTSLLAASLAVALVPGVAADDYNCNGTGGTDVGGIGAVCDYEDGTYEVNGYDDNGLPVLSGFIFVDTAGSACADDNGHHHSDPETGDAGSESPTCA